MQKAWISAMQFPHETSRVEWRETHISQILLTGEWVYKIKKPVNFGFLDFSTLAQRKHYCEEELRLNRRSAPHLYESVVPLFKDGEDYNFCGKGEVIDYAVKMKQFDPDALLLNSLPDLAENHDVFQVLAFDLAAFHDGAQRCADEQAHGDAESVLFPVEENFRQILPRLQNPEDMARLDRIQDWSQAQCKALRAVFTRRKQEGRIRECHGDLHLANIALIEKKPVLFDCIEFNARFRWIDVASDLAFLLMDLEIHGYPEQANWVLNCYLDYSADYELLSVLTFYQVYRAMVRAKVAVLRREQATPEEAEGLLQQFRRHLDYAETVIQPSNAYLAITCGVSGSGKSTLARRVAAQTGAIHLRSDVGRKQIAGLKPLQSSAAIDPDDPEALYAHSYTVRTFQRLQQLAQHSIGLHYPVIVDATFLKRVAREPFHQLAQSVNIPFHILFLDLPAALLRERLTLRQQKKNDPSEADVTVMERQLAEREGFTSQEEGWVIRVDDEIGSVGFSWDWNTVLRSG
ncbi:MAG: AAA family ATPase [Pseudomonadota bacterium]|nr:AAA family ATPase [Pseudomonadota bacterium]